MRIRRRFEFLAANRGTRIVMPSFILLLRPRAEPAGAEPRLGITVSRKVGGAVVRNRWRRRLREAVETRVAPGGHLVPGCDHVLIARPGVAEPGFDVLVKDLVVALRRGGARLKEQRA